MRTIGWPYLLLCVFLFLLSQGTFIALGLLPPLFKGLDSAAHRQLGAHLFQLGHGQPAGLRHVPEPRSLRH